MCTVGDPTLGCGPLWESLRWNKLTSHRAQAGEGEETTRSKGGRPEIRGRHREEGEEEEGDPAQGAGLHTTCKVIHRL